MSIRLRLSLWYTALLAVILVLFSLVVYWDMAEQAEHGLDQALAETGRHLAEALRSGAATLPDQSRTSPLTVNEFSAPDVYVEVVDGQGQSLARSANLHELRLPVDGPALALALNGQPGHVVAELGGQRLRVYNLAVALPEGPAVILVGASRHGIDTSLARLRWLLASGGLGALVIAGLVGWAVASGALRPIAEITSTARAIARSQSFERRVADPRPADEVGQLARAFNEMLASLQDAYSAQRRFVADASHELRAPLATIRGNLELLEKAAAMPAPDRREAFADVAVEVARLSRLVSDLLTLARADAGQGLVMRRVDLGLVVLEAYRQSMMMARKCELEVGSLDQAEVVGDSDRLKQLVLILLDNALKYTAGGRVVVSLRRAGVLAELAVADTGIGIAHEDLPHIFQRFYRADKARARDQGGTGLGLAIAYAIVQGHGGEIAAHSHLGRGSTFTVRLPLAG